MLFSKKKTSNNIYVEYMKSGSDNKSKSMKKLFENSNHASIASNRCATNREIQNIASKK